MRNILLIIDLQKDFIYGSLTVPGATQVLPAINEVKDRFDLVYFTLDWHPVNHCSFRAQGGPWPVHCVHHTAGAALDESVLSDLPEEKTRFILKGCVQGPEHRRSRRSWIVSSSFGTIPAPSVRRGVT